MIVVLGGLIMTKQIAVFFLVILVGFFIFSPAYAQQNKIPPMELYKAMADANKTSGWVQFREYNGQQWVYFTPLVMLRCRVKEIRYSINSPDLDETFPLAACHPALPFALPSDSGPEAIALTLSSRQAEKIAVQIIYEDDSESEIMVFEPCIGVGEATCASIVK